MAAVRRYFGGVGCGTALRVGFSDRRYANTAVRFAADLVPHRPTHAVRSLFVMAPHCVGPITPGGTAGSCESAGCPDSRRDLSATGPCGVIVLGVWQSLQPP